MTFLPVPHPGLDVFDVVDGYCRDIAEGNIEACKFVKWAVQRFIHDLKTADERGLYMDWDYAQFYKDFAGLCSYPRGGKDIAGQPVEFAPWEMFIEANIYGWRWAETGLRRFTVVYQEVARKNNKTTREAVGCLHETVCSQEQGGHIVSAATKRDQAKLVFKDSKDMAQKADYFSTRLKIRRHEITNESSGNTFKPLGADADTEDGLDPIYACLDELHAHKTRDMFDVIISGMGARDEPLLRCITTAGDPVPGKICLELRDYISLILDPDSDIEDDTHFGIIYTLDADSEFEDESKWVKANPNLGRSVRHKYLKDQVRKAINSPASLPGVLTKNFNIWRSLDSTWLDQEDWKGCQVDEMPDSPGSCYAGLDLSSKIDLTGFVAVFPDVQAVLCKFWYPEARLDRVDTKHREAVRQWAEQGFITLTEGNEIDLDRVSQDIIAFNTEYGIEALRFDPWNAPGVVQPLVDHGLECIEFGQNFHNFNGPCKELEAGLASRRFQIVRNPVLSWMAKNCAVVSDTNNNIRPKKPPRGSTKKIDGIAALCMALGHLFDDANSGYM